MKQTTEARHTRARAHTHTAVDPGKSCINNSDKNPTNNDDGKNLIRNFTYHVIAARHALDDFAGHVGVRFVGRHKERFAWRD